MHPLIENFLERPTSHKAGAWIVSLLVIGGIFYQYLYGPQLEEFNTQRDQNESLTSQVSQLTKKARELPRYQAEVKQLQVKLNFALQELPDKKEIAQFLTSVSGLAKKSGLEVTNVKPDPVVQRDFFEEVPVSMTVEGSYHQVATLFDEIGRMDRIVNIRGIDLTDPRKTDRGLVVKANCKAITYRYLDEEERAKNAAENEDKKKRRR